MKSNTTDVPISPDADNIPPIRLIYRLMPWRPTTATNLDPNKISSDQIWLDSNGIFYFEIRHGAPPMIKTGNKSTLTLDGFRQVRAEITSLKAEVTGADQK